MKIKSSLHNMPEAEQPRERLMSYGVKNISTAELIAIILKTGTTDKNVIMLSNEVLSTIRSISDLQNITVNKLMNIKGIGRVKALELVAALELGRRVNQNDVYVNDKLSTPCDIYDHFKNLFDNLKQEQFYCFYLDNKKRLIDKKLLFVGTINMSIVHPREIFKEAYLLSASSLVCMHNHPSGDSTPSSEDIAITHNLKEISILHGINLVDHIIIGMNEYYSFFEHGRI